MRSDIDTLIYQDTGFGAFHAVPEPPGGHVHDTFELSVFEGGSVTMLYGGRPVTVAPDRLVVHWGMLPHQMLRRDPHARVVGIHLPLGWILQWALPGDMTGRLLDLEVLIEPARATPCADLPRLLDWHRLLREGGDAAAGIVLAEARARLLRLAASQAACGNAPAPLAEPTAFSRTLQVIIRHFQEPLRLRDIADDAGISPRHLARIFTGYTGQTVNGYITNLRLSLAQRRLMASNAKVLDIMVEAGFSCPTQFYRLFKDRTGLTPAQYRKQRPPVAAGLWTDPLATAGSPNPPPGAHRGRAARSGRSA